MVLSTNANSGRSPWAGYEQKGPLSYHAGEKRWHVTPSGAVKPCKALQGKCPYGSATHVEGATQEMAERAVVAQREFLDPTTPKNHFFLSGSRTDPRTVGDARDLANFSSLVEQERGMAADRVEVSGLLSLNDSEKVFVRRIVQKVPHSPDKSVASWELALPDKKRKIAVNALTEAKVRELVDPPKLPGSGVSFQASTRAELEESKKEFQHRIFEAIQTVEDEAGLARAGSVHRAVVATPSRFSHDADGKLAGRINYGSTGFRPEHLRNAKGAKGVGDKMSVFESDAGAGAAAWQMSKKADGWEVEITGTRGDKMQFFATTEEEARAQADAYFARRVKRRTLTSRARQLDTSERALAGENPRDASTEAQRANRVEFMARLVSESQALEARAHEESAGQADEDAKGLGKLLKLIG